MTTFREANQVRSSLKMKLSNYYWYNSCSVIYDNEDYIIVVHVKKLDNQVRKVIPPVFDGINVRTELDKG